MKKLFLVTFLLSLTPILQGSQLTSPQSQQKTLQQHMIAPTDTDHLGSAMKAITTAHSTTEELRTKIFNDINQFSLNIQSPSSSLASLTAQFDNLKKKNAELREHILQSRTPQQTMSKHLSESLNTFESSTIKSSLNQKKKEEIKIEISKLIEQMNIIEKFTMDYFDDCQNWDAFFDRHNKIIDEIKKERKSDAFLEKIAYCVTFALIGIAIWSTYKILRSSYKALDACYNVNKLF